METGWIKVQSYYSNEKRFSEFGAMVALIVEQVANKISELVDWFNSLDDSTKK